jgi:hypothetical protein
MLWFIPGIILIYISCELRLNSVCFITFTTICVYLKNLQETKRTKATRPNYTKEYINALRILLIMFWSLSVSYKNMAYGSSITANPKLIYKTMFQNTCIFIPP